MHRDRDPGAEDQVPDSWPRLKRELLAALELSREECRRRVGQLRASDPVLAAELESLLAARESVELDAGEDLWLDSRLPETAAELGPGGRILERKAGSLIGSYRLLRRLGSGGMGDVYLAERADAAFHKRVAVKLLRQGPASIDIGRRLEAERQTLAALDHPNVARLLDGGTTGDGLPYLVMEYVDGVSVTDHCRGRRLSIRARLELFLTICDAVAHANRHLVVHRDLKPENILVSQQGEVKLLDFGIAKLLPGTVIAADVVKTRTGVSPMTLRYASPEQVKGEPISLATDVHALGLLLFELLTERHPFALNPEVETLTQLVVQICDRTPARPSEAVASEIGGETLERVRRRLIGDLDTIVLKAMSKDPARRYGSVSELAEDIRRHLDGKPVRARPETLSYLIRKMVARNRIQVAAGALTLASLAAGLVATAWQAREARHERAVAVERLADVRDLANALVFELHDAVADLPGATAVRELLVSRSLVYLDRLAQEDDADPDLRLELAGAYLRIGNVQGNPYNAHLGDAAGALVSYRKGLDALAGRGRRPDGPDALRLSAVLHEKVADVQAARGEMEEALAAADLSLAIFHRLAAGAPGVEGPARSLAISHVKRGDLLGHPSFPNLGLAEASRDQYHLALEIMVPLAETPGAGWETRRHLALVHERIGTMEVAIGLAEDALEHYRRSLELRTVLAAERPDHANALRDVAIGHEKMGDVQMALSDGDAEEASESYRQAVEIFQALAAADPDDVSAGLSLVIGSEKLAAALLASGKPAATSTQQRRALALHEGLGEIVAVGEGLEEVSASGSR